MKHTDKDLCIKILELMGYQSSLADNPKIQYLIYQLKVKLANVVDEIACKHPSTYETKVFDESDNSKILSVNTVCKQCRMIIETKPYKAKGTSPLK